MHQGSCLCGSVKFEMDGEFDRFFLCHCTYCQKDTGSSNAANLFASNTRFEWLSGSEKVKTYRLPETRHSKSFCTECGSSLPTVVKDGSLVVIPAGCLDSEVTIEPSAHLFMKSKANWEEGLESIKSFDGFPDI